MRLTILPHEHIFLSLLRASLWGGTPELPEGTSQLIQVIRLAKAQSLLGIVGDELLRLNERTSNLPNNIRLKLRSFKVNNIMASDMLNKSMMKVVAVLEDNGISPLLLKGAGLAMNYPVPQLRQSGDVDIFVGDDNYIKAYSLLKPLADKIASPDEIWIDKNFSIFIDGVELEIHRVADEHPSRRADRYFQQYACDFMRKGVVKLKVGDVTVDTPSDTFNAAYVFLHMFRHFMYRGVGLRQFCDWMLLFAHRKDKVDLKALKQVLDDMGLMRPWKDFAAVAVAHLGCPEDCIPFFEGNLSQRRSLKILKRILVEGNFGKEIPRYKNRSNIYVVAKVTSFISHVVRFLSLASLYPSHSFTYMKTMFRFGLWGLGRDIKSMTPFE